MYLLMVKGTWGGPWADPGSAFRTQVIEPEGFEVDPETDWWSGDVDGWPRFLAPGQAGKFADWIAGGRYVAHRLRELPRGQRNLLTHSHGLNVALEAARVMARFGERIDRLVDICGPVRSDAEMTEAAAIARRSVIDYWVHVYSHGGSAFDKMQLAGEAFDGHWGWMREHKQAHVNIGLENVGHSGLYNNPALFGRWRTEGLLQYFRAPLTELLPPASAAGT